MLPNEKEALFQRIESQLKTLGYHLVELVFVPQKKQQRLRVTIYHEAGISHSDCETASGIINEVIEEVNPDGFFLEVSSPGIGRVLKSHREIKIFFGRTVKILSKVHPQPFPAILGEFDGEILVYKNINDDIEEHLPISSIKRITLV